MRGDCPRGPGPAPPTGLAVAVQGPERESWPGAPHSAFALPFFSFSSSFRRLCGGSSWKLLTVTEHGDRHRDVRNKRTLLCPGAEDVAGSSRRPSGPLWFRWLSNRSRWPSQAGAALESRGKEAALRSAGGAGLIVSRAPEHREPGWAEGPRGTRA